MSYIKKIILVVTFAIVAGVIYALSTPWYLITNGQTYYYFNWFTVSDYDFYIHVSIIDYIGALCDLFDLSVPSKVSAYEQVVVLHIEFDTDHAENDWRWQPLNGFWMCLALIIAESLILLLCIFYYYKSFILTKIPEDNGFLIFFDNIKRIRRLSRRRRTYSFKQRVQNDTDTNDLLLNNSIPKFSIPDLSNIKQQSSNNNIKIGTSRVAINSDKEETVNLVDTSINITTPSSTPTTTTTTTTTNQSYNISQPPTSSSSILENNNNNNNSNNIFSKPNPNSLFSINISSDINYGSNLFEYDDNQPSIIPPPPPPSTSYLRIGQYLENFSNNTVDKNDTIAGYQGESLI
ncbi:hypothetical protein PPL_05573 [Heterostelium album PN500]|uniref:Uncharacterized protein n=1 Tax=Heterostelium pallidum (strain ATCC 26659 / Pp 5 / PN500) TaxID=670386 RepID=D3BAJ5_HETP5|nr:hypothetical protein PPL_05573 [Heterostelium album PN500]EFA81582.1 hypothetical protein PPL_05573 [Heterostelium album PN500]|eukprot:XP_020433699.1 hypothetical protein PPL_05573 [Heterostelium album PN500]